MVGGENSVEFCDGVKIVCFVFVLWVVIWEDGGGVSEEGIIVVVVWLLLSLVLKDLLGLSLVIGELGILVDGSVIWELGRFVFFGVEGLIEFRIGLLFEVGVLLRGVVFIVVMMREVGGFCMKL